MSESTSFRSSLFYGSSSRFTSSRKRLCKIKSKIEKRLKKNSDNFLPKDYVPRLSGPTSSWKVFYKQKDAVDFKRETAEDLQLFAFEKQNGEDKGQRLYLVASYPVFWHYYEQLPREKRFHYEIIPEGSVCKLYFDLEYLREFNPSHPGEEMVDIFIRFVCYWLKDVYDIDCDATDVLDLDASTERKFSHHLIFQLRGVVFWNNIHTGYFVNFMMRKLNELIDVRSPRNISDSGIDLVIDADWDDQNNSKTTLVTDGDKTDFKDVLDKFSNEELRKLFVRKCEEGEETVFCDTGVYTKNRNFRLFLSSKLGKNNPLIIARNNKYAPHSKDPAKMEEKLFMDSLVSNICYSGDLRILSFDESRNDKGQSVIKNNANRTATTDAIQGSKSSPYAEIDQYIHDLVNCDGKNGFIRQWMYFSVGELLIYDIGRYRWCENVGRQHKSNNIMLVVDLKNGIYYQKCHDPDCKKVDFRSEDHDLPRHLLPSVILEEDDMFSSDEDGSFLDAVVEAENGVHVTDNSNEISDDDLIHFADEMEKNNLFVN